MTPEEVRNRQFDRVKQGYRAEDVDEFLLQVAAEMQALAAGDTDAQRLLAETEAVRAQAEADKIEAENKMYILAQKVEEYREQEDTIKATLLNAQRMGETVVKEAKQKAEQLVREATGQAELLRQQADQEIESERYLLENLRNQVTKFKATVLTLYKQHIESMSALDAPVAEVDAELADYAEAKGIDLEAQAQEEAMAFEHEEMVETVQEGTMAPEAAYVYEEQPMEAMQPDDTVEYAPEYVPEYAQEYVQAEPSMFEDAAVPAAEEAVAAGGLFGEGQSLFDEQV